MSNILMSQQTDFEILDMINFCRNAEKRDVVNLTDAWLDMLYSCTSETYPISTGVEQFLSRIEHDLTFTKIDYRSDAGIRARQSWYAMWNRFEEITTRNTKWDKLTPYGITMQRHATYAASYAVRAHILHNEISLVAFQLYTEPMNQAMLARDLRAQ